MTDDQRLLAVGSYINSALYCAGVFVAGMVTGNALAWRLALVTAGLNFIAYFLQICARYVPLWAQLASVGVTIIVGIAAGVALL